MVGRSSGTLTLTLLEAKFDEELTKPPLSTYITLRLLENFSTKWRLRTSATVGECSGDPPLRPAWDESFAFEAVSADAKLVLDAWNSPAAGGAVEAKDEFLGKVTLRLPELLKASVGEWHELLPGRVRVQLEWVETDEDGRQLGSRRMLTTESDAAAKPPAIASEPPVHKAEAPGAAAFVKPVPIATIEARKGTPVLDDKADGFSDDSMLEELIELDEEVVEEAPVPPPTKQPPAPKAAVPAAPPPTRGKPRLSYFEYTHRGPPAKENQDAYFTIKFDEHNYVFGVLDGHGGDFGRIASQAASAAMQSYLRTHFSQLRVNAEEIMTDCFEVAHKAVYRTIQAQEGVIEKDGLLIMDFGEEEEPEWDAVDGGTTVSLAAIIDGEVMVYAAVGDSSGLFAVPAEEPDEELPECIELIAEHSPTRLDEFVARFTDSAAPVVYNHPDMFDDPDCMLPVFCPDGRDGWMLDKESERKADEAGLGFKTERGDRAAVILTPDDGEYSQMMLNMTRSVGDFYHQRYGVTWKPDVVTKSISGLMNGSDKAVLCVASDGVWDMWTFEEAMAELASASPYDEAERKRLVMDFFEVSREKGQETFADSADNLTGIVVFFDP